MSNQSASKTYLQFSLCCLSFGQEYETRMHHISSYCIVAVGDHLAEVKDGDELEEYALSYDEKCRPLGFDKESFDDIKVLAGLRCLGINGGSATTIKNEAFEMQKHIIREEAADGKYPSVRIRDDLFWDCINGQMSYRDFSVLCAVYSVIGAKNYPVIIRRERVQAGAMGYKSKKLMTDKKLKRREDKMKPLTINQIRSTLDSLEARSLFFRVQKTERDTCFSLRMTADEMRKSISATMPKRKLKLAENRQKDREMRAKIANTIKAVKVL